MSQPLGIKEQQIMNYLHSRVFDPILQSPLATEKLKTGVRYTTAEFMSINESGTAAVSRVE